MDRKAAEIASGMIENIIRELNVFVRFSEAAGGTDKEKLRRKRAIGDCIIRLDQAIVEPIYRRYPDMKPEGYLLSSKP